MMINRSHTIIIIILILDIIINSRRYYHYFATWGPSLSRIFFSFVTLKIASWFQTKLNYPAKDLSSYLAQVMDIGSYGWEEPERFLEVSASFVRGLLIVRYAVMFPAYTTYSFYFPYF